MVLKLLVMLVILILLLFAYWSGKWRNCHCHQGSRSKMVIKRLGISSYDPSVYKSESHCAICMDEFTPNCDLTVLPCDERHYFHTKCIQKWLEIDQN